jgi:RNA polymerase sigma-70 factor (ECF subfamily)
MEEIRIASGDPSSGSYDPLRSSLRLRSVFGMEMLAMFEPYLRKIALQEWRRSLQFKESISDIVQESLAAGVRDFSAFEGKTEGELAAWLRRILFRIMHSKLRKYRTKRADVAREVGNADDVSSGDPTPSEIMTEIEQRLRLEIALQEIPPHYRQVIELHHIEAMSFPEIGLQLSKTAESVRKLWVRGLLALQQRLGDLPSTGRP